MKRLNKLSWMTIILFLIISMSWYANLGKEEYSGTINFIFILILFFMIGGMKQILGNARIGGSLSDGIDMPDLT